jgi:signal transduction histidine kinase
VQQIAQRHGGSVRCEARPGGGSCFVLSLPLA